MPKWEITTPEGQRQTVFADQMAVVGDGEILLFYNCSGQPSDRLGIVAEVANNPGLQVTQVAD